MLESLTEDNSELKNVESKIAELKKMASLMPNNSQMDEPFEKDT
jgi:hypothetical protein